MIALLKTTLRVVLLMTICAGGSLGAQSSAGLNEADLAALRYFAEIDDQDAFAAERARLERAFPAVDFAPIVAQISSGQAGVDTTEIWDLIRAEDDEAARARIADFQRQYPGWQPSPDMLSILATRDDQRELDQAFEAASMSRVTEIMTRTPELASCERINNPWRLADMMAAEERETDARAIMRELVVNCMEPDQIIATLQKAFTFSSRSEMDPLFELARERHPDLTDRIDQVEDDITPDPAPASASAPSQPAGPSAAERAQNAVFAAQRAKNWSRCLSLTTNMRSANMRLQRGWCALNAGNSSLAASTFQSVAQSASGTNRRDAAYGWALAAMQLNQLSTADSIYQNYRMTGQQRADIRRIMLPQLASRSNRTGAHRQALRYVARYQEEFGPGPQWLQMVKGWALWNAGSRVEARRLFRALHAQNPTRDTREALRITR